MRKYYFSIVGILLIFLGIVVNAWSIGRLLSPNGIIESNSLKIRIFGLEILTVIIGILLIKHRHTKLVIHLKNTFLMSIGVILILSGIVINEWFLGIYSHYGQRIIWMFNIITVFIGVVILTYQHKLIKYLNSCSVVLGIAILYFITLSYIKSDEYNDVENLNVYYNMYPLMMIGIYLFSLKLRETVKANLAILTVVTYICIFILNCSLPFFTYSLRPHERNMPLAKKEGKVFDDRDPLVVIRDLKTKGIIAYPLFGSREIQLNIGDTLYSLSGISNVTTVFCNESGKYITYVSDEHGFNNPQNLFSISPDIALVGDSFVQGVCVKPNSNIAAKIRDRYPITLNFGFTGMGPWTELAVFREYVEPLQPKVVLWFYYEGNDLGYYTANHAKTEYETGGDDGFFLKYLSPDFTQNLIKKQNVIDQFLMKDFQSQTLPSPTPHLTVYMRFKQLIKDYVFMVQLKNNMKAILEKIDSKKRDDIDLRNFKEILRLVKKTTESWGGKFYFIYLPSWERFYFNNRSDYLSIETMLPLSIRQEVLTTIKDLGIPLIDIYPVFLQHPDPLSLFPFRYFNHYTEEGYQIVGETILHKIDGIDVESD